MTQQWFKQRFKQQAPVPDEGRYSISRILVIITIHEVQGIRPLAVESQSPVKAAGAGSPKETYEQLTILGMFMATNQMALQQNPDPVLQAKMQEAAKGYLEQFLKVDAGRVQIGSDGLVLR